MEMNQPVPELPVSDVEEAQKYYAQHLGCQIEWLYPDKTIGAVSNGETAIFFRQHSIDFDPMVLWVYCEDVDASYARAKESGANIAVAIEDKPWGLRQFTIKDPDGNTFHFHHG